MHGTAERRIAEYGGRQMKIEYTREEIERRAAALKELEESYCPDNSHNWKYWGGTEGLYKLRSCKKCYKIEKYVEGVWGTV